MNILSSILLLAVLAIGTILVILIDAFAKKSAPLSFAASILTLIGALGSCVFHWSLQGSAFGGMITFDSFSLSASFIFCLAALITLLLVDGTPYATAQFHSLLLLTLIGMILLVAGSHLVVIFIGLEMLSLSIYVLAAFAKKDPLSAESGLKYFLLGSFASAFFLYGAAFVYGATGSLQLNGIANVLSTASSERYPILYLGIIFLLVGYAFKISLAPFHMWTPDVYEGAPTPVTAFMAATVKAAALASLLRVFLVAFPSVSQFWQPLIWILSVVTMFFGNLTALWQNNLKRLLAYSSIAHAGYMLTGLLAKPAQSEQTILYYFATYAFMNLGAFAVVGWLERTSGIHEIPQYQSMAYTHPYLAVLLTLFLVSLGGLPPTAGFFGKFYLFRAVLEANHVWIIVIAVINSAISFYYYLRVVISMFTPEKEAAAFPSAKVSLPVFVVLIVTLLGSLWLGLFPEVFLNLAQTLSIASS
jgi:NADH-quinone oxidoreductase subunit N